MVGKLFNRKIDVPELPKAFPEDVETPEELLAVEGNQQEERDLDREFTRPIKANNQPQQVKEKIVEVPVYVSEAQIYNLIIEMSMKVNEIWNRLKEE
jgi:hypothetical protein